MWNLDDLECFEQVVREGSFSGAARALGMTRSAVSKAVRRLEDELNLQLLARTTRQQRWTESGARFHAQVEHILAAVRQAEAEMAPHDALTGRLRVSLSAGLGLGCLADAMLQFMALHPELELDLSYSDTPVDLVADGFDMSVRVVFLEASPPSELRGRLLARGRMVLCASPAYLERALPPQHPSDLKDHACVVFTHRFARERGHAWSFKAPDETPRDVTVRGRVRSDLGLAVLNAVVAGRGVGLLPWFLTRQPLEAGELVALMPSYTTQTYGIYALYPPAPYVAPAVRALIDHLVNELRE